MTHEQEDEVRRVLASTPAEPPMPPEVAQRLDDVLADLVAQRPATGRPAADTPVETAEVVALERRRRRWPRVLAAAASVSILGYGAGAFMNGLAGGSSDAESSLATSDRAAQHGDAADDGAAREDAGGAESAPEPQRDTSELTVEGLIAQGRLLVTSGPRRLGSETLREDVSGLLEDATLVYSRDERDLPKSRADRRALAACELPLTHEGDRLAAVRLDGARATLVVRGSPGATAVAQVYSCDDPALVLATTRVSTRR